MRHKRKENAHYKIQQGLTLVELIVVLGIVAVVSGVILFNYNGFKGTATTRALAQEVALAIRKAQTYATSVQSVDNTGGDVATFPAFGISFSNENDTSSGVGQPSKKQFILFADIPNDAGDTDGMYTNGGACGRPSQGDECLESFSITSADRIVKICTDAGCLDAGTVDVVFNRPAPDAMICVVESGACQINRPPYLSVIIESVASGKQRTITVWNTGQISVQ